MFGQFPPPYNQLDPVPHGGAWVRCLSTGRLSQNCLLVTDAPSGGAGLLTDPGDDATQILRMVESSGAEVATILITHAHFDHIGAVQEVREALGVPVYLHPAELEVYRSGELLAPHLGAPQFRQPAPPDAWLAQDQLITAGGVALRVRELPGHSPGHVVFVGGGFVLAGDTLLGGGAIAPTRVPPHSLPAEPLPGADRAQLLAGIERELLSLPPHTVIYPGHGAPTTTQAEYDSPLFRRLRRARPAPAKPGGGS